MNTPQGAVTVPVEVWLRGPIAGITPLLQPAAHALVQVQEDVMPLVATLTPAQLWARPGGVASIGFHVAHLPGSLDRLLTYSRGAALNDDQLLVLAGERSIHANQPSAADLMQRFTTGFEAALAYLRAVDERSLTLPREVGRQRLPSTTLGLIFHAAEHASRHAGQVVTLSAIVRAVP